LLFVPSIRNVRAPFSSIVIFSAPVTFKFSTSPLALIVFSNRVTFVFIFIFSKLDILCIIFISWLSDEFDLAPELIPKLRISLPVPPSRVPLIIVPAPIVRISAPSPISTSPLITVPVLAIRLSLPSFISIFPLTTVFWVADFSTPLLSVYLISPDCSIRVSPLLLLSLPDMAALLSIPPFTIVPDKVSSLSPVSPNMTAVP